MVIGGTMFIVTAFAAILMAIGIWQISGNVTDQGRRCTCSCTCSTTDRKDIMAARVGWNNHLSRWL